MELALAVAVAVRVIAVAVLDVDAWSQKEEEEEGAAVARQSSFAATSAGMLRGCCLAGCPNRVNYCRTRPLTHHSL